VLSTASDDETDDCSSLNDDEKDKDSDDRELDASVCDGVSAQAMIICWELGGRTLRPGD